MCSIGALDAQARWSTSQRTRCRLSSSSTRTGTRRGQARQNCVRRKTSSTSRWPCEARQKVVRRKLVLWSSDSYDLLNTMKSYVHLLVLMCLFWFLWHCPPSLCEGCDWATPRPPPSRLGWSCGARTTAGSWGIGSKPCGTRVRSKFLVALYRRSLWCGGAWCLTIAPPLAIAASLV